MTPERGGRLLAFPAVSDGATTSTVERVRGGVRWRGGKAFVLVDGAEEWWSVGPAKDEDEALRRGLEFLDAYEEGRVPIVSNIRDAAGIVAARVTWFHHYVRVEMVSGGPMVLGAGNDAQRLQGHGG